jgi:hypothetical protein
MSHELQSGQDVTELTASSFFTENAADLVSSKQGAAAMVHILLSVGACAGTCSEEHAATISDLLTSARECALFVAPSSAALTAKFATVCAADKQCRSQQAALISLLSASLSTEHVSCSIGDGMHPDKVYPLQFQVGALAEDTCASVALLTASCDDRSSNVVNLQAFAATVSVLATLRDVTASGEPELHHATSATGRVTLLTELLLCVVRSGLEDMVLFRDLMKLPLTYWSK